MADPVSDEQAITTLVASYGALLDRDRVDEWLELFAPDAQFLVYGRSFDGHDGLRAMATGAPGGIHMGAIPVIAVDGDRARTEQSFVFIDSQSHSTRIGWYDDELVRTDGRWRFQKRQCTFATADGPSERP